VDLTDRFLSFVPNRDDDDSRCWEWTGELDRDGYGKLYAGIRLTSSGVRRPYRIFAHRYAYELWMGPIIEGECVLHTCDNRRCVNPSHLWLGSVQDNNRDRHEKGRTRGEHKGEEHHGAKLSEEDVAGVRAARSRGVSCGEVASSFGISKAQVSRITNGRRWSHV
jgi:hypothetical protein